ncbi:MAG: nucleotidyltransferase domain-containing protein [Infirmifilum sp.]|uniref:nucleotidyltransferase domain-containing protein n=1 Tax=Infirmifilum TaxID=2856573 RepID=UPI002354F8A3
MPKILPVKFRDRRPVVYSESTWKLLNSLRAKALQVLKALENLEEKPLVIGSLARGDVTPSSDIDIFYMRYVPSWRIALSLEQAGYDILLYRIVQATPQTSPRFTAVVEENVEISVPLSKLKKTEEEFPFFAGAVSMRQIVDGVRVRGVNKQLLFIEPTGYGHEEWSIIGREKEAAEMLGISIETVLERVAMREKRAREGRTGFFINVEIPGEENPESIACKLARQNAIMRRAIEGLIDCE